MQVILRFMGREVGEAGSWPRADLPVLPRVGESVLGPDGFHDTGFRVVSVTWDFAEGFDEPPTALVFCAPERG
jgi:hypothetical protein